MQSLRNLITQVTGLDHFNCAKASKFQQNCNPSCLDLSACLSRSPRSREKSNWFYIWLRVNQTVMSSASQTQKDKDNLFRTLSPSLTISHHQPTQQPTWSLSKTFVGTSPLNSSKKNIDKLDYINCCRRPSFIYLMLSFFSLSRVSIPFTVFLTSLEINSNVPSKQQIEDNNIKHLKPPPSQNLQLYLVKRIPACPNNFSAS